MVQLRQDYQKFVDLDTEVIAVGQDSPNLFKRFWREYELPFIGLADASSKAASFYYQQVSIMKLGRMPAVFIIDKNGLICYAHYGKSMSDIPENSEVLEEIKSIIDKEKISV